MNRILTGLLLAVLSFTASADIYQAQYGVAKVFPFWLYNADGTLDVDEADGGTEVALSCNQGAETTATNDFVDEGTHYSISLTAAELQCQTVVVVVNATVVGGFVIQTHGHASAFDIADGWVTGDAFARLGAPAGASVSADIVVLDNFVDDLESRIGTPSNLGGGATVAANLSDIEGQTDDIGTAGAGLTNIDLPNQTMDITGTLSTVTAVTNTVTANATQISGDSAVADRLEAMLDGTCGSYPELGVVRGVGCTAQAYTAGTPSLTLDASAAFGDDTLTGATLLICGSTQGYCQAATAASNVGSTDIVTLTAALPVAATGTVTYTIFGTAASTGGSGLDAAGVRAAVGLASANLDTQLTAIDDAIDTEIGAIKTKTDFLPSATAGATGGLFIAGTNAATTITTGLTTTFTGNLTGSAGSVTGAVGSVTGSVGSVGTGGIAAASFASNAITASAIATGAIDADSIAFNALTSNQIASTAATEIGDAAWASATRTLSAGTNIVLAKGTGVTGFNDLSAAQVNAEADTALADYDPPTDTEMDAAFVTYLEQAALADALVVNCTVNTANFAGSATTVACILTDRDAGAITAASGDLEGRELVIRSGAQIYEGRFINDTTWDAGNSELQLTLSRALPGTLADAVTAIIR